MDKCLRCKDTLDYLLDNTISDDITKLVDGEDYFFLAIKKRSSETINDRLDEESKDHLLKLKNDQDKFLDFIKKNQPMFKVSTTQSEVEAEIDRLTDKFLSVHMNNEIFDRHVEKYVSDVLNDEITEENNPFGQGDVAELIHEILSCVVFKTLEAVKESLTNVDNKAGYLDTLGRNPNKSSESC